ncbi:MAG: VWA domain-containing protein [Lachnospiraceae bacterium]|nr:VWA domain-containing protein [Lachnospiraceae bacterium]
MRKFHNIVSFLILFTLILNLIPTRIQAAEQMPTRAIYVVYDDSGSMIVAENGQKMDTWCKAKYSLEVFAAMLGVNDTMNVYFMSDFDPGNSPKPRLTLNGSAGAEANVEKVHNLVTRDGNTPFSSVQTAYNDLVRDNSDEKWLVILTDGMFNDGNTTTDDIDKFFAAKSSDINVIFLGMGPNASAISENPAEHIYYEHAQTNDQILSRVTSICSRVFDYDRLEVNANKGTFEFDIPMSELIVFAQGGNVSINGLTAPDGSSVSYTGNPVTVIYSEVASTTTAAYAQDPIIDRGLEGSIATFRGLYDPGEYKVEVNNAKTLEIYYKPAVEIMAFLETEEGMLIPYNDGVPAGDYILKFAFVKQGTDEPVGESDLLGEVSYEAQIYHDGLSDGRQYSNGDRITVEEGLYQIDVDATYLKYHTVSTELDFKVFRNKPITFERVNDPEFHVDSDGLTQPATPIEIHAMLDGREFTSEEWQLFDTNLSLEAGTDERIGLNWEKGDEPGSLYVTPYIVGDKPEGDTYKDAIYKLESLVQSGDDCWSGSFHDRARMVDDRPWWEQHAELMKKIMIGLGIFFLILGYIPGIKKYLPKALKKYPRIYKEPTDYDSKPTNDKGLMKKNRFTSICPYIAERGSAKCDTSGSTRLKLKALGSDFIEVVNTNSFAGRDVKIGGKKVQKGNKEKFKINASSKIVTETKNMKYTCYLDQNVNSSNKKKKKQ